jgi:hypothetical protein
MKAYRAGTKCRVDLFICGNPLAKVTEVIEPGDGRSGGSVRVTLLEKATGYYVDESIVVRCSDAVPLKHVRVSDVGQIRYNVNYRWEK